MVQMECDGDILTRVSSTQNTSSEAANKTQKIFDKKNYRQQKYSNKHKLDTWDKKRKEIILRNFYRDLIQKKRGIFAKPLSPEDYARRINEIPKEKSNSVLSARFEQKRRRNEKRKKKEEALKEKAQREEALKQYKKRRTETFKKLSRKTKKGQPVMKDRLELLLAKIQLDK